jgi:hypothetical protein
MKIKVDAMTKKVVATKKISKLIHLEVITLTIDEWEKMCH